jgi:hypothetical protein
VGILSRPSVVAPVGRGPTGTARCAGGNRGVEASATGPGITPPTADAPLPGQEDALAVDVPGMSVPQIGWDDTGTNPLASAFMNQLQVSGGFFPKIVV